MDALLITLYIVGFLATTIYGMYITAKDRIAKPNIDPADAVGLWIFLALGWPLVLTIAIPVYMFIGLYKLVELAVNKTRKKDD